MMGVSWVQPWMVKDVLVAWRRRTKKVSHSRCLEFDPVGYLVVALEGKKPKDF